MPTLCLVTGIQTTHFLGGVITETEAMIFCVFWTNRSGIAWNLTYIHTFHGSVGMSQRQ